MASPKSPIDDLYFDIYGEITPKPGQAYERLVAAAFKLLLNKDIGYDQRVRGEYSKTVYQLDSTIRDPAAKKASMVEVKDYTVDNRKVGRGDIQKLQGALSDLSVDNGIFASATDYTRPAVKYAESSVANPLQKPIELFHIRPSSIEDEKGRLKSIQVTISAHVMDYQNAKFIPLFTMQAVSKLKDRGYADKQVSFSINEFYDEHGCTKSTVEYLTGKHPPGTTFGKDYVSKGCWTLPDEYLKVEDELYELNGLEYEVPFQIIEDKILIEADGKAKLFVQSSNGEIDKLISDVDLRKVAFIDGKVVNL